MVDVYSTEAERRAAIEEVTRLRRQFDTTTAAGARAFAKDPEAQAALARLDAAKSAAGMRTAAEDLAALNKYATADTGTVVRRDGQEVIAKPGSKAERAVNKQLNAPSRQYFKQVNQAYNNPDLVPTWAPPKKVTPDLVQEYAGYGVDASKARYDWVWVQDARKGQGRWAMGLIGLIQNKPTDIAKATPTDIFYSDYAPLAEARAIKKAPSWGTTWNGINLDVLEQAIPEITFSDLQEIYYRLTLERDTDITIEDILDKYDDMFGGR